MYAWEGKSFDEIANLTLKRKPERYPVYCVVEGTQDGERVRITQRFRDVREMSAFLQRMEPQRWGIRALALVELKPQLQEALTRLDVFGPTAEALNAHNSITEPDYQVLDWGEGNPTPG
ncbi:hypothetical protein H0Z60_09205 [Ectothiorhodospiraceae bacterium WFHF3C12]|nr:hypothetical protein [Ectothiorhodospiraceae bacterium WFHF3C12]